jgi:DNA-binding NarL/FixJ family response regulator
MDIRIAIAEDSKVNRNTIVQKMSAFSDVSVLFLAYDGHECLEKLKETDPQSFPHIVFLDLEMPVMNGIDAIGIGKVLFPSVHFIVLTVLDNDDKIFEAIKAGASGYLLKHETGAVIYEAMQNVLHEGGAPMSPAIARKALTLLSQATMGSKETPAELPEQLSDRDKAVLENLVKGWNAKRSAEALGISAMTVRKHITNIYRKLHVHSKADMIHLANSRKWFS